MAAVQPMLHLQLLKLLPTVKCTCMGANTSDLKVIGPSRQDNNNDVLQVSVGNF